MSLERPLLWALGRWVSRVYQEIDFEASLFPTLRDDASRHIWLAVCCRGAVLRSICGGRSGAMINLLGEVLLKIGSG